MDTKEVIYRLRDAAKEDEGPYAAAIMRVWGPLPEFQMYRDLRFAADRLSEQQQVIDELVKALGAAQDHLAKNPTGVKGWNKTLNLCADALSRAKEAEE